jgi:hypothetical protein
MDKRIVLIAASVFVIAAGGAAAVMVNGTGKAQVPAIMQDHDENEEIIAFADAPEAVRTAAQALCAPGGSEAITQTEKETQGGVVSYGVEFNKGDEGWSADISAAGVVSDLEREDGDEDEDEGEDD